MSRIGKKPIKIPDGVSIVLEGSTIRVKGGKGELQWEAPSSVRVSVHDKEVIVERDGDTKNEKVSHGLTRSLVSNMVTGVSEGFTRELELVGVGYKAQVNGDTIDFSLGLSHPTSLTMPEGITAEVDKKQTKLTLRGIKKQLIGQIAAEIRALRPPDAYKGKGIRYADEKIKLKPGKAGT